MPLVRSSPATAFLMQFPKVQLNCITPFLCGNSGPQWAGWLKNEITSVGDLKGLKFRTTGIAPKMAAKLSMAAEAMSGPAMFQALQTGALDAGEFIGPWTDSALGYYQVAPFYYWPDNEELVVRITESFIAYRDLVGGYMGYADNGQMNARAGVFGY